MSSHIWILSVPIGFVNLLYPRILALVLCEKSGVKLDNANPRQQVEGKEVAMKDADGYTRRAYAAHQNGFESMIFWTASLLLARVMEVDSSEMNKIASLWVACRIVYNPLYILNKSNSAGYLRTAIFTCTMVCNFYLTYLAIQKA